MYICVYILSLFLKKITILFITTLDYSFYNKNSRNLATSIIGCTNERDAHNPGGQKHKM